MILKSLESTVDVISDYLAPAALSVALLTAVWVGVSNNNKQASLAVLNYSELSSLYTGEVVGNLETSEDLEALTTRYMVTARRIADEYALESGTLVIMQEAVVGGSQNAIDITEYVHQRTMNELYQHAVQ